MKDNGFYGQIYLVQTMWREATYNNNHVNNSYCLQGIVCLKMDKRVEKKVGIYNDNITLNCVL